MDTAGVLVKSRALGVADLAADSGQMVGARSATRYPTIHTAAQNDPKTPRTYDASNIGNVSKLITMYGNKFHVNYHYYLFFYKKLYYKANGSGRFTAERTKCQPVLERRPPFLAPAELERSR